MSHYAQRTIHRGDPRLKRPKLTKQQRALQKARLREFNRRYNNRPPVSEYIVPAFGAIVTYITIVVVFAAF